MSNATPIVFVVDDEPSVRESLSFLVESLGWQPETFGSGQEFLSRQPAATPSCLVLDLNLPDLNGCDLQAQLADRFDMPIIFMSGYGDVPTTVRAMKAGAVEFFTKPFANDAMVEAIRIAIGRSRTALADIADVRSLRDRYAALTLRERQVMALVVAGRLNKQVGSDLSISEITVKAHRGRVMHKMNAKSVCDLVRMASRLCLETDSEAWTDAAQQLPHPLFTTAHSPRGLSSASQSRWSSAQ
jgi:FixJ family two-component response regulator